MKLIKLAAKLLLILTTLNFPQTQEKIPWPSLADSPWPVARGDVQGTGRSEYVGPKTPNIIWKKTYTYGIFNGPILDENGKLLFGTRSINWSGTENYFYKIDSLGDIIWRFSTDNGYANDCAPAVAEDGSIYFGSQSNTFYAINKDGSLKWKYQSTSSFNLLNIVLDKEGSIYTASSDSLFSFDPHGNLRFSLNIPLVIGRGLSVSPDGKTIYVPSVTLENNNYRSFIYAIDNYGEINWSKRINITPSTILVDNDGFLYLKGEEVNNPDIGSALICLNSDGDIEWQFEVSGVEDIGGVTMDKNGNIFFTATAYVDSEFSKVIVSLDYGGDLRWYYKFDKLNQHPYYEEIGHGLVCDADGTIYAGSTWGFYFYAIGNEGQLLWKIPLNGLYSDSSPVIAKDGTLYIGLHGGASNLVEDNLIAIKDNPNSIKEEELPSEYKLEQNYPNPFNPSTTIKFSLPERSEVKLSIFNLLGQEIEILFQGEKEAGSYEYVFENKSLSTGVYFYVLESQQSRLSRKMMLIK